MRTRSAIIESIILGIGVLLSIQGTAKAVGYSSSYIPYFALAALGIVFIVILILLRKKKFTFLLGIGFIVVYLGDIMTMPGLPKQPAAEKIDIDNNGIITGLF